MKKNNKGFTLVELLAVMVILGIMMAIAMPNVTGILNKNRASTYVEDAKKLTTTAEYKLRGSNTGLVKPANGQCIVMNLAYLDNSEFEEPPYGGQYLKDESYVVIKKNGDTYEYYVQLLEKMGEGKSYRGIPFMEVQDILTLIDIQRTWTNDQEQGSEEQGEEGEAVAQGQCNNWWYK